MEIVLSVESKDMGKASEAIAKDPVVSLASIIFKDGRPIGKRGSYIYISGLDAQCRKAVELTKGIAKVLEGREKEEIVGIIREEQDRAVAGFGGVFGSV